MKSRSFIVIFTLLVAGILNAAPKYVFYFIGDGMGFGAMSLAQSFNRMVLGAETPLTMMQLPVTSVVLTHSASSPVTDSAAAGTALATGHKTFNGMLGVLPDSTAVTSIATKLHDMGYGVGLVTTVAPDDATPGAFYAHQPNRGMFYEIGCDAAVSGFEFIAGANLRGLKDKNGNPTDLLDVFEKNHVSVVRGLDGLAEAKYKNVLLLAKNNPSDNEIGLTIDSIEGAMTLPAMTQACLDHLMANTPDRFFMMVEGGSIDHAGHANDAATSVMETICFDEALAIAYRFYIEHPEETLIVVTADHETGGLILANRRLHYDIKPNYLQYQRMSKDMFSDHCKALLRSKMVYTWNDMKEFLQNRLGLYRNIPIDSAEDTILHDMYQRTFELRNTSDVAGMYNNFNSFAEVVYGLISEVSGIGWTTGDHSGTPVPLFAAGVEATRFSGMKDNTDIPQIILSIVEPE